MPRRLLAFLAVLSLLLSFPTLVFAGPQSTTYEIKNYGFGSGDTGGVNSTNYSLYGISGQTGQGSINSTTYTFDGGLVYLLKANVPGAPTLSTPGNNYDRIKILINTSNNPIDTVYALQISTSSNFLTGVNYVKSDDTIGPTLTSADFQTNAIWGSSGFFVTGLTGNTTYYVRVKARQGNFTETEYGPSASITTNTASLSFSINSSTVTFNNLNSGNSYTDAAQSNTLTTSTNAYNGYTIYGRETQALTATDGNTIINYGSPNSAPTTWNGTGFGYTTNDTSLTGGTANRFNGSKYAGFGTTGPGDPVADDPGPVTSSQISNEQFTISYRITGSNTTPADTYTNTIIYTIVPTW